MGAPQNQRTTREKLDIFGGCFTGLTHVYGTYDPDTGQARQVKEPVTDQVLLRHLQGHRPYGVYLLVEDRTWALTVDFDKDNPSQALAFVASARKHGAAAYIERSKSKGYHVWMFFEPAGVLAARARLLAQHILQEIGVPDTEVFPKQDRLDSRTAYGNFVNAPLFGAVVPEGRTVFVDENDATRPYPDQWKLLATVQRLSESALDHILSVCGIPSENGRRHAEQPKAPPVGSCASFGLPPCAQKMLAEGVRANQRVACFRLAVHLRKAGLPRDIAVAALVAWAGKNRPDDGKARITQAEVTRQTTSAYAGHYRGCGCEDVAVAPYCQPGCPLQKRRQAAPQSKAKAAAATDPNAHQPEGQQP